MDVILKEQCQNNFIIFGFYESEAERNLLSSSEKISQLRM